MSIEQDLRTPQESAFAHELDCEQGPTAREYERRWWTLGVLCLSLLMIVMANASLNVALPTLSRDLHAGAFQILDPFATQFLRSECIEQQQHTDLRAGTFGQILPYRVRHRTALREIHLHGDGLLR